MYFTVEDILEYLIDLTYHPQNIIYGKIPREDRRRVAVALHRLSTKGYIQKGLVENEICLKLTELGLEKLNEIENNKLEKSLMRIDKSKERWDGKWRVVVFDIPEHNRRIRDVLRQTLKVLEFKPLQKSIWISKRNFTKDLRQWTKDLGLSSYILIFETKELGIKLK